MNAFLFRNNFVSLTKLEGGGLPGSTPLLEEVWGLSRPRQKRRDGFPQAAAWRTLPSTQDARTPPNDAPGASLLFNSVVTTLQSFLSSD